MITAEIITIGDELLIGQVIDTNSAWLGQELNNIGVSVQYRCSVRDDAVAIQEAITSALQRADLVFLSGGLGPTKDDVTKKTLAHFFQRSLVVNQDTLQHLEQIFAERGRKLNELNRQQALVPENCQVLLNKVGTAPGMAFEINGKWLFSLPGVPYELKYLAETYIFPLITEKFQTDFLFHRTIHTVGIPESTLAQRLENIENDFPPEIRLAYLPNLGGVRLRLSLRCKKTEKERFLLQLHSYVEQFYEILGDSIFGEETATLEQALVHLLERNRMKIAFAESCTGGACTARLVQISGASKVLEGSIVCYSNAVKERELGVSAQTLAAEGAVSQVTAEQMAAGVRSKMGASIGVAITGIAGPEGGSPEKPVGTVWIAVATESETQAIRFQFEKDRQRNIERTVWAALDFARRKILQMTR